MKLINNIIDIKNSIINSYVENYEYPWDLLSNLETIIINIGKTLSMDDFYLKSSCVWINKKAIVDENVKIIGPCIIDEGAIIKYNAFIRENVIIGKNCVVGNSSEIKNSILFNESKVPHFNYIGDSILGYKAHFGAGSITSNVKSDNSLINIKIDDVNYNTNKKKLGSIVGDNVEIGCNAVLNPGTIIGKNTNIYPLVMVRGYIKENRIVKSMDNIVEKKISEN